MTCSAPTLSTPDFFDSYDEFVNAPPLTWVIEGITQQQETNLIVGLPGEGKTWTALSVVKALLEGSPLFGHFPVPVPAERVIYLIPESGRSPFFKRLKAMRLDPFVHEGRLLVRTLSKGPAPELTNKCLLEVCAGADVFLDTLVRFGEGEENSASDNRRLSGAMFTLLQHGARTFWGLHHSPKKFGEATEMTLENSVRGSGDIGAMVSNVYGLRQLIEATNLVHIECLKGRDLDELVQPFQIEGRPWIDREGNFRMVSKPGDCEDLASELHRVAAINSVKAKKEFGKKLWLKGAGRNEIAAEVKECFGKCSPHTVTKWIEEWDKRKGESAANHAE